MTDTEHTPFHFSPRPNRAGEIQWRQWGPEAFREAKESGKPILLSLSAVWCHWCHVMDETSYSDPGVISYINERYIPVRVDNDQRPDINARYNMGGWPTTALLTAEGEVLAGGTYVPPEQMRDLLPKVAMYYGGNKQEVAQKAEEMRRRRSEAVTGGQRGQLSGQIFQAVLRGATEAYDPLFGGFGEAPKFPHTDAIDLLLYAHRRSQDPDLLHMARKTLEFMARGELFDQEWGGFFRYATKRDWSEPHYEKMLEDNANLLRNLLALYRITGDPAHAEIAGRAIGYLEAKLRDKAAGFFYGSQDADEEFYKLPAAEREKHPEPYIDRTCYTSWSAMAASAYLEASWTLRPAQGRLLDRPDLRDAALAALEFAWQECREPGGGMYRFNDGSPQVPGLLGDQAYTARALLDAHEATGDSLYLERALELAHFLTERFADKEGGGFFDTWDETEELGRLSERQKSAPDNAVCAEVFIRLHHLTRDEAYNEVAQGTLEAFAEAYPNLGYFAAGYARQVDTFLNPPVEVNIVGDLVAETTRALHRAALGLDVPSRVVQVLDPRRDTERLKALYLPPEPAPAAYVCAGAMCSAPVTRPEELVETVRQMQKLGQPL
ncbi:MAG: thioredoxin domain-containing protein [Chloroflexi bacterium]|nr:thioredoxin domain-containing protein [Chloroflexota bacterium]